MGNSKIRTTSALRRKRNINNPPPLRVDVDDKRIRLHQFEERLDIAGYRAASISAYVYAIMRFVNYLREHEGGISIDDVEPEHVTAYQTWLRFGTTEKPSSRSASMQRQFLNGLKAYFRVMYDEDDPRREYEYIIVSPRQRQQLPKNVPSEKEMAALLDGITPISTLGLRNRAMLELLYATAVRSMELLSLTIDCLDLAERTLFVHGKGAKDRIVPVGGWVVPWLMEYLQIARPNLHPTNDLLFVSKTGRAIPHSNLCYTIRKYAATVSFAAMPSPHTFRHACATHLLANGADVRYIQELLGHSDLSTTQIYTKVNIRQLKAAHSRHHPRENPNHG